ncbi:hypothetical protein STEG23_000030, partial [Scotinomys teguina]
LPSSPPGLSTSLLRPPLFSPGLSSSHTLLPPIGRWSDRLYNTINAKECIYTEYWKTSKKSFQVTPAYVFISEDLELGINFSHDPPSTDHFIGISDDPYIFPSKDENLWIASRLTWFDQPRPPDSSQTAPVKIGPSS